jgi:prephenate dehydrogenase
MVKFNKIAIIGVGLIGGSIGMAARKKGIAKEIVGVCRHQQSLRRARNAGAIDQGTLNYKMALQNADLVILATPVKQIIKLGTRSIPYLRPGCILTDVGSTKQEIVSQLEKGLPKNLYFVGAHPLAGSEKRGVGYARADLFNKAFCLLTKTDRTNPAALKKLTQFWQALGCRVKVLTPGQHDRIVATISHLPHLVAVELVNVADKGWEFAGTGFSDTTRIASSESEIWTDIFLTNIKYTLKALDAYLKRLQLIRRLIADKNQTKLDAEFKKAKTIRDALQK